MTKKKITKVETEVSEETLKETRKEAQFIPSPENKKKATQNRIIAGVLWLIAIAIEIVAILQLKNTPINMALIIGLIVLDAVFAIAGSLLWKKANRLDPASEKDKVKFFIQNQLGMIVAIIAFLPLIILLLSNEDLDGKEKGLVTGVAVVALLIAGVVGFDLNPASIEKYAAETTHVHELMGEDKVYWTNSGRVYHLFDDCYTINSDRTEEIFQGKVAQAYELKNIKEICKVCDKKATQLSHVSMNVM